MVYEDKNKNESLFHATLIYLKIVSAGTASGNKKLKEFLEKYGSFEGIYNVYKGSMSIEDSLKKIKGLENIINKLNNLNFDFKVITIKDINFPEHLRKIENATPVLYARGDLNLLNKKSIAVVGSRHIYPNKDRQVYEEAYDVMKRLVEKKYVIVSGLAEGCDTIGHIQTIENGGKTIAVLGTPLDQYYPSSNKNLQEKIAREHLLISQYPIGIRTFKSYFTNRNHTTVSLATEGIVVIKASDNSGTMHAVKFCSEQKKPIYVLANNFSNNYKWLEIYKNFIKRVDKK
ncbi:MAG: DNA-processing protein DprA [Candidatus Pacearchaeota archaeon]